MIVIPHAFDGSVIDLTTGPRVPTTPLASGYNGATFSVNGTGASNLGAAVAATAINYGGSSAPHGILVYAGGRLTDSVSQLPIQGQDQGPSAVLNCKVPTAVNAQVAFNNSQPAIQIAGLIQNCSVSNTAEDGIWPLSQAVGHWTVIENLYAMGGSVPFYSGWCVDPAVIPWQSGDTPGQSTGQPMTKAQILAAVNYYNQNGSGQNGGTNGVTVPWGGFIIAPSAGSVISPIYQCVGSADGTTNPPLIGNESTSTWPNSRTSKWSQQTTGSAQPFTSGNALLAYIGAAYHCDTIQCVGNPSRIVIRNFVAGQFADSVCLLQNDATTKTWPPMNWTFEHGILYGAGSVDIPLSTLTGAGPTGTNEFTPPTGSNASLHNPQGPFLRNSDGTWQVSPNAGMSVPWYVTMRDLVHMNSTSNFVAARNQATSVSFDKAYNSVGIPIVATQAQRDLLTASQYGWDATDQRVAMMREGTYNWQSLGIPAPVSSVLEARFQALNTAVPTSGQKAQVLSAVPCSVAAQCMPVIEKTCRNQQGTPLTPATNAGISYPVGTAVTNSDGYYIGA